jgi:hypothetical protein
MGRRRLGARFEADIALPDARRLVIDGVTSRNHAVVVHI